MKGMLLVMVTVFMVLGYVIVNFIKKNSFFDFLAWSFIFLSIGGLSLFFLKIKQEADAS